MGRRERRKEAKTKQFMTWVLVLLMIFSVAGIMIGSIGGGTGGPVDFSYGKYDFDFINNYYVIEIDGTEKRFFFHPLDTLKFDFPQEALAPLRNSPVIVVTFDPDSDDIENAELGRFEISTNSGKIIYAAITQNSTVYNDPIIICEDATDQYPVIYLKGINESSITYNSGCLTISGVGIDLMQAVERTIYEMIGVMDG